MSERDATYEQAIAEVEALRARLTTLERALHEARADSERLEYLLFEWAAHQKDDETREQRFRLDWDSGWCMNPRDAIDATRLAASSPRETQTCEGDRHVYGKDTTHCECRQTLTP